MKNKKIFLTLIPALAMTVTALSSCGTIGYGSADTYDLDVNVDTAGVTIKMWTGFGSTINKYLHENEDSLITQFEQLTKINVEYETKGGYENLQTAINLSATTINALPQVANAYPDHMAGYIGSNIQLRLDGLIENDKKRDIQEPGSYVDSAGNTVTTLPRLDYDDFYSDYTLENETLEFNKETGEPYILGVPFNKSTEVLAFNKTFFDYFQTEAGIKLLTDNNIGEVKVPTTWDEVKTVGVNIRNLFKKIGVYGQLLASDGNVYADQSFFPEGTTLVYSGLGVTEQSFRPFSYDSTSNLVITLIRQYGGTLTEVDPNITGKGYIAFDNEKTVAALTMLKDLWDSGVFGIASTPWADSSEYCSNAFKGYNSLMNVGSSGGLSNVASAPFAVGIAPIPYKDAEHKYVISQGTSLGLFQISEKDPDREKKLVAAWKLIVFLSQAENGKFAADTGYFPTCTKAITSDAYVEYLNNPLSTATDKANQAAANINNDTYSNSETGWVKYTDPGFRGSSDVRTQVGYIPGYIFNEEFPSIQAVIDHVVSKLKDYIKP